MTSKFLVSACLGLSLAGCSHASMTATPNPAAKKSSTPAPAASGSSTSSTTSSTSSSQAATAVGPNGYCTSQAILDYKGVQNAISGIGSDEEMVAEGAIADQVDPTLGTNRLKADQNAVSSRAKAFKSKYGDFACNIPGPGVQVISSSDIDQAVSQLSAKSGD